MTVSRCIRCQSEPGEKDKFCKQCSAPLVNRCTNRGGLTGEPCTKKNDPDARYCVSCGAPTLFQKTGLLASRYSSVATEDEWEEMELFTRRFFEPE